MAEVIARRTLLAGLGFVACAPAIVRASSLMPVRAWKPYWPGDILMWLEGSDDGIRNWTRLGKLSEGEVLATPFNRYLRTVTEVYVDRKIGFVRLLP